MFGYGGRDNTFGNQRNSFRDEAGKFISRQHIENQPNHPPPVSESSDRDSDAWSTFSLEGARIVDIKYVISQLTCDRCKSRLHLHDIVDENLKGLAAIWTIQCNFCSKINKIATSKRIPHGHYSLNAAGVIGELV